MTVISFSEVWKWQTCKRQWYYANYLGLRPVDDKPALKRGIWGHKMLEKAYRLIQQGTPMDLIRREIQNDIPIEREIMEAWALVDNYLSTLNLDGVAVKVEEEFIVPLDEEISIGFKPDLLWYFNNSKKLQVDDYKFVERAWSQKKLARYVQLDYYIAFLQILGFDIKKGVLRFFNIDSGKIYTKDFTPSEATITRLLDETLIVAYEIHEHKQRPVAEQERRNVRTVNYLACQYCDFVDPCNLEQAGKSAEKTLKVMYRKEREYGYRDILNS